MRHTEDVYSVSLNSVTLVASFQEVLLCSANVLQYVTEYDASQHTSFRWGKLNHPLGPLCSRGCVLLC